MHRAPAGGLGGRAAALERAAAGRAAGWEQLANALEAPRTAGAGPGAVAFDDEDAARKASDAARFWEKKERAGRARARYMPWAARAAAVLLALGLLALAVYFRPRSLTAVLGVESAQGCSVVRITSTVEQGEPVLRSVQYELGPQQTERFFAAAEKCLVTPVLSSLWNAEGGLVGAGVAGRTCFLVPAEGGSLLLAGQGRLDAAGRLWCVLPFGTSDLELLLELDAALDDAVPVDGAVP